MHRLAITILLAGMALLFILALPLAVGIRLPDLISAPHRTLAQVSFPSGNSFHVIQYWNRCDFYTTALMHTAPDGQCTTNILDGDDSKSWSVPIKVNESARTATVTLGGKRVRTVNW